MKSVLISIQPKWCELIASGKKTVEVRKTKPKLETPFKCYIYCTKGNQYLQSRNNMKFYLEDKDFIGGHGAGLYIRLNGTVIGEFVCDEIFPIRVFENGSIQDYMCHCMERSCVPYDDIANYIGNDKTGYGWHISDFAIYDKPREIWEFAKPAKTAFDDEGYLLCDGCQCANWNIDEVCTIGFCPERMMKRPPQSWCYVEELNDAE